MKIKTTITEEDLDAYYDLLIFATFAVIAKGIIWKVFVA
jgi:hypothetical protein